jgi:hypothetical protein
MDIGLGSGQGGIPGVLRSRRETGVRAPAGSPVRGALIVDLVVSVPIVMPDRVQRVSVRGGAPGVIDRGAGVSAVVSQPPVRLPLGQERRDGEQGGEEGDNETGSSQLFFTLFHGSRDGYSLP